MSGFFNSFYYGKAGKADYTLENLPTNRVSLFFEMLRVRISGVIGMNLIYILFCLPAIVWSFLHFGLLTLEGEIQITDYVLPFLLLMVPFQGISGIGAAGMMYVLRNWARDQHAFTMSDFKDAVKENWVRGLIVGLLNGLSLLIVYVSYQFYGAQVLESGMFFIVPQMMVLMLGAIWWMMNMVIYTMMVTYKLSFGNLIRNAFIVVLARLPFALLIWAGSILPLILMFFVPTIGLLIIGLFYLVIGFGLTGFLYASFSNACFDRLINPRIEGAPVNMGLRDPNLEFEDDEEEEQG